MQSVGAFERRHGAARRAHQDRNPLARTYLVEDLSASGPHYADHPRPVHRRVGAATSPGRRRCGCRRAIASLPASGRPGSLWPSPANSSASSGRSPAWSSRSSPDIGKAATTTGKRRAGRRNPKTSAPSADGRLGSRGTPDPGLMPGPSRCAFARQRKPPRRRTLVMRHQSADKSQINHRPCFLPPTLGTDPRNSNQKKLDEPACLGLDTTDIRARIMRGAVFA
jgi:hypothetical protein